MSSRRSFMKSSVALLAYLAGGARKLSAQVMGQYLMNSGPGPETIINGKRVLYFGGTSYLGLQTHPEVIRAAQQALTEYGVGSATGRSKYGTTPLHLEVEKTACHLFGTEDAIYLSSGYLSNIAGFQSLCQLGRFDAMFLDENAHWSITDFAYALQKPVFTFAHRDPESLNSKIKVELKAHQRPLVATDGAFPTLAQIAPLPAYLKVVEAYDGCLWIDDAHAMGMLGPHGRGTYDHYGMKSPRLYLGGTTSKSFGGHGGLVVGTTEFIEPIREGHVVNGSSAPAAASAAAALRGMQLAMDHPEFRQRLWQNAKQLKAGLGKLGFPQEDSPLPVGVWTLKTREQMAQVQEELFKRGICIQHTHYVGAGPNGLLKAVVFANHQPEQIDRLLVELKALI